MKLRRTLFSTTLAVIGLAVFPGTSRAALNAYATIQADTQGTITGDVAVAPHETKILVESFGHGISAPFDPATGITDGTQQHRPIRILKPVGSSSPKLLTAMTMNELLTEVTIEFYRPSRSGAEEHFYTVKLVNANVVGIMPYQSSVGDDAQEPMREWVSFTYERIAVTFEVDPNGDVGDIVSEADW